MFASFAYRIQLQSSFFARCHYFSRFFLVSSARIQFSVRCYCYLSCLLFFFPLLHYFVLFILVSVAIDSHTMTIDTDANDIFVSFVDEPNLNSATTTAATMSTIAIVTIENSQLTTKQWQQENISFFLFFFCTVKNKLKTWSNKWMCAPTKPVICRFRICVCVCSHSRVLSLCRMRALCLFETFLVFRRSFDSKREFFVHWIMFVSFIP